MGFISCLAFLFVGILYEQWGVMIFFETSLFLIAELIMSTSERSSREVIRTNL
jgi:hypothetical protein